MYGAAFFATIPNPPSTLHTLPQFETWFQRTLGSEFGAVAPSWTLRGSETWVSGLLRVCSIASMTTLMRSRTFLVDDAQYPRAAARTPPIPATSPPTPRAGASG